MKDFGDGDEKTYEQLAVCMVWLIKTLSICSVGFFTYAEFRVTILLLYIISPTMYVYKLAANKKALEIKERSRPLAKTLYELQKLSSY